MKIWKILFYVGNTITIVLGIIVIYQIMRILLGGSWSIEEVILSFIIANFTTTLVIIGWIINIHGKIANVDKKLHGHLEWHKARDV